jgi:3-phosphoshikimate 1-carboxyvinyltransferase
MRRTNDGYDVVGADGLSDPKATIDCGNSGTTMRLLMGVLAGRVDAVLDGDESLRRRPMARAARPLNAMGASITTARFGVPPVRLRRRTTRLKPIRYKMPIASAQVKSALLLAALHATAASTIVEPAVTRNHTEIMLRAMGAKLRTSGRTIRISPSALAALERLRIPGDSSAAIYVLCADAVLPAATLHLLDVVINPTRTAALDVMCRMGARVRIERQRSWSGEPVADISITGGAPLRNVSIPARAVPMMIDEIPALCALAATARGVFYIRGAAELRVKESNRIQTTVELLRLFGADAHALPDGITVRGGRPLRPAHAVTTHGDHRIGLAAAILAAATRSSLRIHDSECIATSFPDFAKVWRAAFGKLRTSPPGA